MNDLEFNTDYKLFGEINSKINYKFLLNGKFIENDKIQILYKYIRAFILLNPFFNMILKLFDKKLNFDLGDRDFKSINNKLLILLFLSICIIAYTNSNIYLKILLIFVDLFYLMIHSNLQKK